MPVPMSACGFGERERAIATVYLTAERGHHDNTRPSSRHRVGIAPQYKPVSPGTTAPSLVAYGELPFIGDCRVGSCSSCSSRRRAWRRDIRYAAAMAPRPNPVPIAMLSPACRRTPRPAFPIAWVARAPACPAYSRMAPSASRGWWPAAAPAIRSARPSSSSPMLLLRKRVMGSLLRSRRPPCRVRRDGNATPMLAANDDHHRWPSRQAIQPRVVRAFLDTFEEERGEIALAGVGEHGQDDAVLLRRLGVLQCGRHGRTRGNTDEDAFLLGQAPCRIARQHLVDGEIQVEDLAVENLGHEVRGPALDLV